MLLTEEKEEEFCQECGRLHDGSDPCPLRIARARVGQEHAIENLTSADIKWIKDHKDHPCFYAVTILEDAIATIMFKEIDD
jgi:hypothetical protein